MHVLLIFDPTRTDVIDYFRKDTENAYSILFHEKKLSTLSPPPFVSAEFFWSDYRTPDQLLNLIQPEKIVFSSIIDIKQIALNCAAKKRGIRTIYLDHGISTDLGFSKERHRKERKVRPLRIITQLGPVIRNRYFYYASARHVRFKNLGRYLTLPAYFTLYGFHRALSLLKFEEKAPDEAILFCRKNREEADYLYQVSRFSEIHYTGIPFFDKFFLGKEQPVSNQITYIDHPYLEFGIAGWNAAHHERIAKSLEAFAKKNKLVLYIKLHPVSDRTLWDAYHLDQEYVKIIQTGDFTQTYLSSALIISFSSTLVVGFISARKSVVLVGWHPHPEILGVDYSKINLVHVSFSTDDLERCFDYWKQTNLPISNQHEFAQFIRDFNDPFDGKAAERVIVRINS